jgi:hypothetical protein
MDQLVAYADGDTAGVDLADLARHVAECASCKEIVTVLTATRESLRRSSESRVPPPRDGWAALSARYARHRRRERAVRWAGGLMAASLVGVVVLSGVRERFSDPGDTAGPATYDATRSASADETIAALSQVVVEGRSRLPSTELHAMDAVVHTIDEAIRQTQSALAADPADPLLRTHLAELHRKRVSALRDYVDLIRSQG